jgi:phosphoglycerate kinase
MEPIHPIDSWDRIIDRIRRLRHLGSAPEAPDELVELLIHLRMLGQDERIPDRRNEAKDDSGAEYARVSTELKATLDAIRDPTPEYLFYFRETMKKLPVRESGADLIETIREAAERFDEGRDEEDPLRSFASDLRKETHRRLSPRILTRYIEPYFRLLAGDREPMDRAGYPAVACRFSPATESPALVRVGEELRDGLRRLWDYESGNAVTARRSLEGCRNLFVRCFLSEEARSFLSRLAAANLQDRTVLFDLLVQGTGLDRSLHESFRYGRIGLNDLMMVDLDIGRLLFIFATDLTNNHFAEIGTKDLPDVLAVVKEMLQVLAVRGMDLPGRRRLASEIDELLPSPGLDVLAIRRCLASVANELQSFLRNRIIARTLPSLTRLLQDCQVPAPRVDNHRSRFFNNVIRRTHLHVLTEFVERALAAVDAEIALQAEEDSLWGRFRMGTAQVAVQDVDACVAATWEPVSEPIRPFLGGKGNGLLDMAALGLSVPQAVVLGLPFCDAYVRDDADPARFRDAVMRQVGRLETVTGLRLGDPEAPLLVSVRSGADVSLPGALITILNVGATRAVLAGLGRRYGDRFAAEVETLFVENCGAALEIPPGTGPLRDAIVARLGTGFFDDPMAQVLAAVRWVFGSSRTPAARAAFRTLAGRTRPGTAVTIQRMVFGNRGEGCLTGVMYSRNPVTGAAERWGNYKELVQGQAVVQAEVLPRDLDDIHEDLGAELDTVARRLEQFYRHEVDIEFTVEDGRLYLLQARRAKIGPFARIVTDTDFLREGLITLDEFRRRQKRLSTIQDTVSVPRTDLGTDEWNPPVSEGLPISAGVVSGRMVLTPEKLRETAPRRETIIYLCYTTRPTDYEILNASHAIVNVFPGRTSHAAITAMALNRPCIVGLSNAEIDEEGRRVIFRGDPDVVLHEGERITVDANTGAIYRGPVPLSQSSLRVSALLDRIREVTDPDTAVRIVAGFLLQAVEGARRETAFKRRTLGDAPDLDLEDRPVLLRLDLNVPVQDGTVLDPIRVEQAIPTIRAVIERGATPIVCSHLGDPAAEGGASRSLEQIYEAFSLRPVARMLEQTFPGQVVFHELSVGSSGLLVDRDRIRPGRINVLENLRFASGEKENDPAFCRSLANLVEGGCYINDAFNVCHRLHASIAGVPRLMRWRLAGPLLAQELRFLRALLARPATPFVAILGGRTIATKMGILESLLQRVDRLVVGGGVGYTLLRARGVPVGRSLVDASLLEAGRTLLRRHEDRIRLPNDYVVQSGNQIRTTAAIGPDETGLDIGPASLAAIRETVGDARTIFWDGPVGLFERREAADGTLAVARILADQARRGATVVLSGKSTAKAARLAGIDTVVSHVSTGGAAFLEFLDRLSLPGVAALDPVEFEVKATD